MACSFAQTDGGQPRSSAAPVICDTRELQPLDTCKSIYLYIYMYANHVFLLLYIDYIACIFIRAWVIGVHFVEYDDIR